MEVIGHKIVHGNLTTRLQSLKNEWDNLTDQKFAFINSLPRYIDGQQVLLILARNGVESLSRAFKLWIQWVGKG